MNTGFYITISNELYNNTKITNEELVIYILLKRNYIQIKKIGITSINMLLQFMHIENRNPRLIKTIKNAIYGLIKKKYIKNILDLEYNHIDFKDIKNNDLFYAEIEPLLEQYFLIYDYDLDNIFKYLHNTNIDKFSFVRYFVATQRVISNESRFGFLTQKSIKELIGENKTVSRYNHILQNELKLIQYNSDYMTSDKHYTSTFFGKYDEEENFNFQLENQVKSRNLIYSNKIKSNQNRSNTQKLNWANKNNTKGRLQ